MREAKFPLARLLTNTGIFSLDSRDLHLTSIET